ncbi:MAG: thioredoxin family protein [Flavobacteriales bacterium]
MSVENVKDAQFEKLIKDNDKVIVKYYADWCGSCKLFSPKFKRLAQDPRFDGVKFIEVNAEENELARKAANVDNLPFIATFKKGTLAEASATSKEDFVVKMLEKLN